MPMMITATVRPLAGVGERNAAVVESRMQCPVRVSPATEKPAVPLMGADRIEECTR